MSSTLILCAHPDLRHSRVNAALLAAARALQQREPQRVVVRDLYALYPDFDLDVPAEQALAASAGLLVWLHPIHWYAMPALMKLWVDEVLAHGWAYGHGGTALHGKALWPVLSTGGPASAYRPEGYNRHDFEAFLPPYRQTAALCGLRFLEPLVLHGAHAADAAAITAHVRHFVRRLEDTLHGARPEAEGAVAECRVPDGDRPGHPPPGPRPAAEASAAATPVTGAAAR